MEGEMFAFITDPGSLITSDNFSCAFYEGENGR